jgi:hypothetical protein
MKRRKSEAVGGDKAAVKKYARGVVESGDAAWRELEPVLRWELIPRGASL